MTADEIIDGVLHREGGYSDRAQDKGGPTNYGVTTATLGAWRKLGRPATRAEVKALKVGEAHDIYRQQYLTAPRFDRVADDRLRALLVDFGVHSGPVRAVKALQRAVDVPIDGVIGAQTLDALRRQDATEVYRAVLRERGELIAAILQRDRTQLVFAAGWLRRLMEFV
ncbi:MAG: glycosyl hydrolase 108 family protein [Acidobacteriota bacterium]|nr:glycosyl hydrolase 108 family protein [Acidobacteriota bacterium]